MSMDESKSREVREMIPVIKHLFQTRHYIQCASVSKQLLARSRKNIHPIHCGYLNFYIALSHDSLAREAGTRNRDVELDLAETHYLAVIADLMNSGVPQFDDTDESNSPTSSESDGHVFDRYEIDTASQRSNSSMSTAATSIDYEERHGSPPYKHKPKRSVTFDDAPISTNSDIRTARPALAPVDTRSAGSRKLSAELTSFLSMVRSHLADVRKLKDAQPTLLPRYYTAHRMTSPFTSRPVSRDLGRKYELAMEQIRWQRKNMVFRPRFDPTSVQKLCTEALNEL